jgi:uncharacterized protein (DUF58 family)
MKVRQNFWFALSFFLGLVILDMYFHQLILQRLAVLISITMVVGFVWAFFSLWGIQFERSSTFTRYECGEIFEEKYEIKNNSILQKLWIRVEDFSRLPSKPATRSISQIQPRASLYFQSLMVLSKRGDFPLGPTLLYSGDPFGYFSQSKVVDLVGSILVLPLIFPMQKDWNAKGDLSGGRAHRERKSQSSLNATAVRDYQPGDALNKIHWKTSARSQKWMVKEFEQDPFSNIWMIIDGNESVYNSVESELKSELLLPRDTLHFQPQKILPKDEFEYAVSTASTFVDYFITVGRGVGLLFSGEELVSIAPEKGSRQKTILLEALAYICPKKQGPLSGVLQSHSSRIIKGNSMIVITSSPGDDLISILNSMVRKGISILLVVIDPRSFSRNPGTGSSFSTLQETGFNTQIVRYGDDLGKALEEAVLK